MSAPALAVDWDAVKAHALMHGIRPTAEAFGIAPGTLFARSSREGWLQPARQAVTQAHALAVADLPKSMQPKASNACKPSEAAQNQLSRYSSRTRLNLSKTADKGARTFAKLPGEQVIANANQLKALTDTADKLHGWSKAADQPALVSIHIAPAQAMPAPVIDVQAELL